MTSPTIYKELTSSHRRYREESER